MAHHPQKPLPIFLPKHCSLNNYIVEENTIVINALKSVLTEQAPNSYVYLWGLRGSGKSHLLTAACHWASENYLTAAYLPIGDLVRHGPAVLEGLEDLYCVAIDDIHAIAGLAEWEKALFNAFNRFQDADVKLFVSADQPPSALSIRLADLRSRLSSGPVIQLTPLSDQGKRRALERYAEERYMKLSKEVLDYIFNHCRRDIQALLDLLERLDEASLSEQRKITIPFIKALLSEGNKFR